jgi:hypothetical protein
MSPLLYGLALGGAAMYFFDPDRGRRRRALVRDKAVGATNCARNFVDAGTRDLKNRGSALTGRVSSIFSRRQADDRILAERVRSVMGHHVAHPGAIDVHAANGKVTLNGSILSHEHPELIESVSAVSGVKDVIDQLAVYETAEGISELQGGREPGGGRSLANPQNWSSGTQLVAGAALGLYLLRHSRLRSLVYFAAAGAALMRLTPREQLQHLADTMTPEADTGRAARATRATAEGVF